MRYDEAKAWFWARTWFCLVPAVLVSVAGFWFSVPPKLFSSTGAQAAGCVGAGVVVVLAGVIAAGITTQAPWMRLGWRFGFVLNGPAGALIAGVVGALVFAGVQSLFGGVEAIEPTARQIAQAKRIAADAMTLVYIGVALAAMWGFVFASWFAMRRDKYFVEGF